MFSSRLFTTSILSSYTELDWLFTITVFVASSSVISSGLLQYRWQHSSHLMVSHVVSVPPITQSCHRMKGPNQHGWLVVLRRIVGEHNDHESLSYSWVVTFLFLCFNCQFRVVLLTHRVFFICNMISTINISIILIIILLISIGK